ncbi:MAG: hypothetical protein R3E50_14840 [Halioglobus sp.]
MPQVTREEAFADGVGARTPARAVLHKRDYTSSASVTAEWDAIWTRCWLFAGLAADLPDPGDYFVYSIGRESIVVLRDTRRQLRAITLDQDICYLA